MSEVSRTVYPKTPRAIIEHAAFEAFLEDEELVFELLGVEHGYLAPTDDRLQGLHDIVKDAIGFGLRDIKVQREIMQQDEKEGEQ